MQTEKKLQKRGPRIKGKGKRQHIDITLSIETLEALDTITNNRSGFIDEWLRQNSQIAEYLKTASQTP